MRFTLQSTIVNFNWIFLAGEGLYSLGQRQWNEAFVRCVPSTHHSCNGAGETPPLVIEDRAVAWRSSADQD